MSSAISVVPVGDKKCKPFLLNVKIAAPEAGYRFEVLVEKGCTAENDPIWKLVFDLYKKFNNKFEQIVHVSFTAGTDQEIRGVQNIAENGLSKKAAGVLKSDVFPVTKKLEDAQPTAADKAAIKSGMSKAVTVDV